MIFNRIGNKIALILCEISKHAVDPYDAGHGAHAHVVRVQDQTLTAQDDLTHVAHCW